jgi:hypothetical protein
MTVNTAQKLQHELNSLLGLLIINLLCSALAFAFGAYFLMPNLILAATTQTVQLDQVGLMVLGGLAFALAFRWLLSTAKIMDTHNKLNLGLRQHKKDKTLDDEALTGLIVKMTAAYRDNKLTLRTMMTISKVACALFTLGASATVISVVIAAGSGLPFLNTAMLLVNAAICYAVAAACYVIPHFFGKYSAIWDARLEGAAKAEAMLEKQFGDAP